MEGAQIPGSGQTTPRSQGIKSAHEKREQNSLYADNEDFYRGHHNPTDRQTNTNNDGQVMSEHNQFELLSTKKDQDRVPFAKL